MDPNAALRELLEGVANLDREAVADSLQSLSEWIEAGGFLPADPREREWGTDDRP